MALNLSYALAKQGKTCLVDADLRKGRLARAFSLNATQGLGEVLDAIPHSGSTLCSKSPD